MSEVAQRLDQAQQRLRAAAPAETGLTLVAPVPRITLTQQEACAALGCSEEFFVEHVRPHLRVVRRGRKRLFPVDELRRVVDQLAESVM